MPSTITNQASLTFNYGSTAGTALSNIATTVLDDPISVGKTAVGSTYRLGSQITYVLSVENNGTTTLSGLTVTDNLGLYTPVGGVAVVPLTYANDAVLYRNGSLVSAIVGTVSTSGVTFTLPVLPANTNFLIVYTATVNNTAPLATGSTIVNTATFQATGITSLTATATVTVENYADIRINKDMTPNPVMDGDTLLYTFTVNNYGNTAATDVVLTDTFNPAPSLMTVAVNGTTVASTDYTYTGGVLTLPASGATLSISVPAATTTQDLTTGVVTVTPGTTTVSVSGTI